MMDSFCCDGQAPLGPRLCISISLTHFDSKLSVLTPTQPHRTTAWIPCDVLIDAVIGAVAHPQDVLLRHTHAPLPHGSTIMTWRSPHHKGNETHVILRRRAFECKLRFFQQSDFGPCWDVTQVLCVLFPRRVWLYLPPAKASIYSLGRLSYEPLFRKFMFVSTHGHYCILEGLTETGGTIQSRWRPIII